jgi:hypothetical protein
MSSWSGRFDTCPICGQVYERLRTGLTYRKVRALLWTGDPDSSKWKYKRRATVLGLWHSIKLDLWAEHLAMCEANAEAEERGAPF